MPDNGPAYQGNSSDGHIRVSMEPAPSPDPPIRIKTTASTTKCCALLELDQLSAAPTPEEALQDILYSIGTNRTPFIIFTGIVHLPEGNSGRTGQHPTRRDDNYGKAFADLIVKEDLGTVTYEEAVNQKTYNTVGVWLWKVNREKVNALWLAEKAKRDALAGGF